jgi:hypothetical protein
MKESNNKKTVEDMNLRELTAPCGLDCFNCQMYLANFDEEIKKQLTLKLKEQGMSTDKVTCQGCRKENGICPLGGIMTEPCKVFKCINSKEIESCADCDDFPCDNLHPYADMASEAPHNIKVFNLALIRNIGVEKWAKEKSKLVRDTYFYAKFNI